MNENAKRLKSLLREIVVALTDFGNDMNGLLSTREELMGWLKEKERASDATVLELGPDFKLVHKYGAGLVWVETPSVSEELIDFHSASRLNRLVRKVVIELTFCGDCMGGLLRTRDEVADWLKDKERLSEARMLKSSSWFTLMRGSGLGLVWFNTCDGSERLIDFHLGRSRL